MYVEFDSIYGRICYDSSEAVAFNALRRAFSVLDPNRYAIEAFRKRWWDGYHNTISKDGKYLRGLTPSLARWLQQQAGITLQYQFPWFKHQQQTVAALPHLLDNQLQGINLAKHQYRMVEQLMQHGHGTTSAVTGSGKTESICLLIKMLLQYTSVRNIFVLVHLTGLMDQSRDRFCLRCPEFAVLAGMLGDGRRPKEKNRVIFSTQQSLNSVLGLSRREPDEFCASLWAEADVVIIDECHNVTQESYLTLLSTLDSQTTIYQFSGTPETDDQIRDWTIVGVGGDIVCTVGRKELEDSGFIAKAVALLKEF